jgi:cytidylate kinase
MDGRDIGTYVFPQAELKLFMTADESVRVKRRWAELSMKDSTITLEDIKKNIRERDYEDTHRSYQPLRKADDAVVLDNTNLSIDEQLDFVLKLASERIKP